MSPIWNAVRLAVLVSAVTITVGCAHAQPEEDHTARFREFAERMAERHDFAADEVADLLAGSERQQDIIDALDRPAEALPWYRYRPIFVVESRIAEGVDFWREHEDLLERASDEFGVPPEIIVAIIGVETRYGRHKGGYRVLDALRTMAFDYPARESFGQRELEEYLLLAREEGFEPDEPEGSYAGAMGIPQFISSSYREYAVDFNDNGVRDLFTEMADAIGSVGSYLARHDWQAGEPGVSPARVRGDDWQRLRSGGLSTDSTVDELRAAGATAEADYADDSPAKLIELETNGGEEHWIALDNFYVITRYNHSTLYAMAVHQLSEAIAARREGDQ